MQAVWRTRHNPGESFGNVCARAIPPSVPFVPGGKFARTLPKNRKICLHSRGHLIWNEVATAREPDARDAKCAADDNARCLPFARLPVYYVTPRGRREQAAIDIGRATLRLPNLFRLRQGSPGNAMFDGQSALVFAFECLKGNVGYCC